MAGTLDEGLFPPRLISADVSSSLPKGYRLRALRKSDYSGGFLDCLRVLTTVGDITRPQFEEQYDRMKKQGSYYVVVIEDANGLVVATGALIVERKLCVCPTPPVVRPLLPLPLSPGGGC